MTDPVPWAGRRLHLIGLGGAGMSAYALAAHALGAHVTGSDRAESPYSERLRAVGIEPAIGHSASNVPPGGDVEVVYSTAIPADNPEREAARARGLPERPRADLLGELAALRRVIAVAGAHGKTTTAAMVAHALLECGLDPGYLVGGEVLSTGANGAWGTGEWLVVEADESDRSFLALRPEIAVLTNVELDHHATYASRAELDAAFAAFLRQSEQAVVWDRPDLLALADGRPVTTFDVVDARPGPHGVSFSWDGLEVDLAVPGSHNALNAAAALTACRLAGADPAGAARALASFSGAGRRFEEVGTTKTGARVVDDYAHHPTEVRATIAAARTQVAERVVAVFQPHLYSRTERLAGQFGAALATADLVVVVDVYPARERPEDFPGVSGLLVAEAVADARQGVEVLWMPGFDEAERALRARLRAGDLCLVLGAGDVDLLGRRLVDEQSASASTAWEPAP